MQHKRFGLFGWLVLAGMLFALSACNGDQTASVQATPTPLPTPVAASKPTFKVQTGDITAQVQFAARVIPAVQEELFFRADGRVRRVYVRGGDQVTEGQVLADLVALDRMESDALRQQYTLRRVEIAYEMAWLRQQQAATRIPSWDRNYEIEMKMQAYEVELAEIALAETKLQTENLETSIADSQIISPMDGKVLSASILEGQEVRAFQPLITVGDDTVLEVGAALTSAQMQEMTEGLPAMIELTNRPGVRLEGFVRRLPYPYGSGGSRAEGATAATGSPDNTTRIGLNEPEIARTFRTGELVQVTVIREQKEGILWLPPQAIRTYEGRNFVVVQTDGLPRRQDIKLGLKNEERVEVLDGLEEGWTVIAP